MDIKEIEFKSDKIKEITNSKTDRKKKITQQTLAEKAEMTVSSMFYGNPTAKSLAKIATALEVDVNAFFNIPPRFLGYKDQEPEDGSLLALDKLADYIKSDKNPLYKELYNKEKEVNGLVKLNAKYREMLLGKGYSVAELDVIRNGMLNDEEI